jgi:hypothetical protein
MEVNRNHRMRTKTQERHGMGVKKKDATCTQFNGIQQQVVHLGVLWEESVSLVIAMRREGRREREGKAGKKAWLRWHNAIVAGRK